MLNRLLVLVLVTSVFARPDVSHIKTVESHSPVTSYDVPISSIDKKYVTTTHNRYIQQGLPTISYLPPVTYDQHYETSSNILPTLVSNPATGQYGLLGQYGTSSEGVHVVTQQGHGTGQQGAHFISQQGHGTGHQGTHFVTQQGHGVGQGTHIVTQEGHGIGDQGTHFVTQQGHGSGLQGTHFVTQQGLGAGTGHHDIHFVTQQGQGSGLQGTHFVTQQGQGTGTGHHDTHFVTQQGHGSGLQGTHFVTQQGQGTGTGHHDTHFVTQQGHGSGLQGTHFVTQQGHGIGQGVHFVTQEGHGIGHQGTHFVTQQDQGHGSGQISGTHFVTHGQNAGLGHQQQQQYVKNEEHVYYFSAPKELQHKTRLRINVVPTHTKKTNVIYVNAPSVPQVIPEVVVPPHQLVEDKTKVVVLVKEHDQFIPISIPAPVPISKGKTEVFVVKYTDKNDAEHILSGSGKFHESSLIQQDKPAFLNTLNANVIKHHAVSNIAADIVPHSGGVSFSTLHQGTQPGSQTLNIQQLDKSVSNIGLSGNAYGLKSDGGSSSISSHGTQSIKVVDTTPKIESYIIGNVNTAKNLHGGSGGSSGNTKTVNYEVKTANVVSSTPTIDYRYQNSNAGQSGSSKSHYELKTVSSSDQQQSGIGNLNVVGSIGSNAGDKQVSTYEVKTVESVKSTPTVFTYGIQNIGDNLQDGFNKGKTEKKIYEYHTVSDVNKGSLGSRFSGDVDGSNQGSYTIQSTEFVQNNPNFEYVGHDNIEGIKKALGQSDGINIVSISKGTVDGSASGTQSQAELYKSLGISSGTVAQHGKSFVRSAEISDSTKPLSDTIFESSKQNQFESDVTEIISASS